MTGNHMDEFERAMAEVNAILDNYLRQTLLNTESPETVEVALTLFHDGWTGSMQALIDAARRLAGGS